MSELLALRDYQQETIDAIEAGWNNGLQRPASVLATGLGKTICFAHLIRKFLYANPHKCVLVLAHTDELVNQAAKKIKAVAPHLPIGIVKGKRNEVYNAVVVASVQSLRTEKRRSQINKVGLIIVDECHHATAKTYMDILTHFGAFDPNSGVSAVGFTATMGRSDSASLGSVWQEVVITRDILFGIEKGYLLDVFGVSVEVPDLDLDAVKKSRGDFQDGDLGRAMTESLAPELVAKAYREHASDRSGLMFWPTVDAAHVGADAMNELGIVTEVIHGTMKDNDSYDEQGVLVPGRHDVLKRFLVGTTQVISNCMVLTEGFDAPLASCVVIARPTKSRALYQQIVGRVLRPFKGQTKALILDVCGTSATNDLCSIVDLTEKKINVKDGQTLAEAVAEAEELLSGIVVPYHGPVVFSEFDPFARASKRVWMETKGGTHFLTYGTDRYIFLVPATGSNSTPGMWDVVWCTKSNKDVVIINGEKKFGGFTTYRNLDRGIAAAWAQDIVDQFDGDDFGHKSGSWRNKPANEKQIGLAKRLGCEVPDGIKSGEISTLIDTAIATPRVDFFVGKILEMAA